MKFLGKWMELGNIILSEVTQKFTKEHTWYVLPDKWIIPEAWNIQETILKPYEAQEEGRPTNRYFIFLRRGNKIPIGGDTETKCGAETKGKAIQRLPHLRFHPI